MSLNGISWFDILTIVFLASAVLKEATRGGRAIPPTKIGWLVAVGVIGMFGSDILARFNIHNDTLLYILAVAIVMNIIFIIPAIAANALISTAITVFLLAFIIQFFPQFEPENSWAYTAVKPFAYKAYVFVKPYVNEYLTLLKNKIQNMFNFDINQVKPTLPPGSGNGGEVQPTFPVIPKKP